MQILCRSEEQRSTTSRPGAHSLSALHRGVVGPARRHLGRAAPGQRGDALAHVWQRADDVVPVVLRVRLVAAVVRDRLGDVLLGAEAQRDGELGAEAALE